MPKAFSYIRFSTPEQQKGDSYRRQIDRATQYASDYGLELDEEVSFEDLGTSAFRGQNVETGKLGEFLEAVRTGLVPAGSYLLVESLDRISRTTARKALRVLEDIVDAGVTLVTLSDRRVYTKEAMDNDPTALLMSVLIFMRANDESAMKSWRLKEKWKSKRAAASDGPVSARCPSWLTLNKQDRRFEVDESKADVVRRVYRLAAEGTGQNAIAKALNTEGVPPLGRGKLWHKSTIAKLLSSPSVIGTYVPHVMENEDGKRVRRAQEPVEGYYPTIVDEDTYHRVKAMQGVTKSPQRGRNAGQAIQNLLGGLARCPVCGGTMTRVYKGKLPKGGAYLACLNAKQGNGCRYKAVRYDHIEAAILDHASAMLVDAPSSDKGENLDEKLEQLGATISATDDELERLLNALRTGQGSPTIAEAIRATESEREALNKERRALLDKRAAAQGPLLSKRVSDLQEALAAEPLDRTKANTLLRQIIAKVTVDYDEGALNFTWHHGGTSQITYAWPLDG